VIVRTPAIHAAPDSIPGFVARAMATGIAGITFPHVTTAAEAARSVELLGEPWPLRSDADAVDILIVEDREGIANVREIVQTPGLSVVFAGPGDLRRAYEGDMEAVEEAIQAVLAACLEFEVPCGVTAGVDDIADRLEQGFRVIIVTEPEAVAVGMRHAGR
jgi:4-hydroxy-2-oxoheptanedioate aldolase